MMTGGGGEGAGDATGAASGATCIGTMGLATLAARSGAGATARAGRVGLAPAPAGFIPGAACGWFREKGIAF